jgi:tetratricopeptide (TPR) repeat protein
MPARGQYEEAVEVCRTGLAIHPGYLSAHVTLGRALLELGSLDEAQTELELVLKSAAENLAALRGLAEIHHRRDALPEALAQYRAALLLARNDPDLQRTVADLERIVEPPKPPAAGRRAVVRRGGIGISQEPPAATAASTTGSASGVPGGGIRNSAFGSWNS